MLCIVPRADANLWFHRCTSAGEQNSHEHVIWGDGDVLNTSLRGRLIWQETCPRATRAFVSHGDPSTDFVYKSLPSRYRWVIAFIFPTIYPLWRLPDQVWVHAFGAVLGSPFALAFVWSPSSLPFPLAHCELQRMRGWVQEHTVSTVQELS